MLWMSVLILGCAGLCSGKHTLHRTVCQHHGRGTAGTSVLAKAMTRIHNVDLEIFGLCVFQPQTKSANASGWLWPRN